MIQDRLISVPLRLKKYQIYGSWNQTNLNDYFNWCILFWVAYIKKKIGTPFCYEKIKVLENENLELL